MSIDGGRKSQRAARPAAPLEKTSLSRCRRRRRPVPPPDARGCPGYAATPSPARVAALQRLLPIAATPKNAVATSAIAGPEGRSAWKER